jgi:hypothetical protein
VIPSLKPEALALLLALPADAPESLRLDLTEVAARGVLAAIVRDRLAVLPGVGRDGARPWWTELPENDT